MDYDNKGNYKPELLDEKYQAATAGNFSNKLDHFDANSKIMWT
jgi:hypothetical protein